MEAADLTRQATVVDGDTLEIHGSRVRLWGIDAPESDQFCRGAGSAFYRCGAEAANKLDQYIARRPVRCTPRGADRFGRTVASCAESETDLAGWLVAQGLALDWPHYSGGRYSGQQREAERASLGIWSGSYIEPWRRCFPPRADGIS